jgi:hypothetical protein
MSENKLRKGGLAKVNERGNAVIVERNRYNDLDEGFLFGVSRFTADDAEAHRADIQKQIADAKAAGEDTWHITMQDDGESRLPPTSTRIKIYANRAYQVLRARCVGQWNYRRHPGQCLLLDLDTGREVWVNRDFLEAV